MAMTMEELLASSSKKAVTLSRGMAVEGTVVAILDKEFVLDLGSKSEGVISKREFSGLTVKDIKVGDKLKAFVFLTENESGQAVLTANFKSQKQGRRGALNLTKFIFAQKDQTVLNGKVVEVNKGGFLVETGIVRGFLPNSQIGYELINKIGGKYDNGVNADIKVMVSEVDEAHERLIFSQKGLVSKEELEMLKKVTQNDMIEAEVVAILPFGLIIKSNDIKAIVYSHEATWDRIDDLSTVFQTSQNIKLKILGLDEAFGRLHLSYKQLQDDPFKALAEKYQPDDVVKGEVASVSEAGLNIALDGAEGFLPADKMDSRVSYELGKSMTFLVDGVDSHKRRVNLAPFITSTAGLIYK